MRIQPWNKLNRHLTRVSNKLFILLIIFLVFIISSGFIFLFNPFNQTAEAAWFNDNWAYREAIPVTSTNGSNQSNVFVSYTLNTASLISAGKVQSSCQDIRITDISGNILPYHIGRTNACNNAATTIDFLPQTLLDKTSTFYVYYGNPTAVSADQGAFSQSQASNYTIGSLGSEEKALSPIAYWKFDEGYGTTTADSTSTGATATLAGTTKPAWQTSDFCISGKCLYFDGSSSKLTVSKALNNIGTIAMWVRPTSVSSSALIDLDGGTHTITISSGTITTSGFTNKTIYVNGQVSSTLMANRWQYVEIVSTDSAVNTTSSLTLGNSSSVYFQGFMDEVKLYPYVRSPTQILADYNGIAGNQGSSANFSQNTINNYSALSDGLTGYWKMDEASWNGTAGEVKDSSGNTNNGTAKGSTDVATITSSGKFDNAGSFDGTDDYVDVGNSSTIKPTSAVTISAWVNISNKNNGNYNGIVTTNGSNGQGYHLSYYPASSTWGTTDKFVFQISNGSTIWSANSNAGATVGSWTHLVGVFDSNGNVYLYVNGVLQSQTAANAQIAYGTDDALIGDFTTGSFNFPGTIDDVRIFNRALSSAQVQALYNFAPGPVGEWNFEEGSGSTVHDVSGNGNYGTWSGTGSHWAAGKYGKAGNFNGTNDQITVSNTFNNIKTISFWYNPQAGNAGIINLPASNNCVSDNGGAIATTITPSSSLYVNGTSQASGFYAFTNNSWQYVTVTISSSGSSGSSTVFGQGCSSYFKGQIDDVRFYNYAQTQPQIIATMNANYPTGISPIGSQLAYWKFDQPDEGSGVFQQNSIPTNSTTLTLSGSTKPVWTNSGRFGGAFSFNGSTAYASVGGNPGILQITGSLTVSAWIKPAAAPDTQDVISKMGSSGNYSYRLGTDANAHPQFQVSSDGTTLSTVTASNVTLIQGTWYHLAGVYNPSTSLTIYLNGLQIAQNTSSIPSSIAGAGGNVDIGAEDNNNNPINFFNGIIDEVKIYTGSLTSDQILLDMNNGSSEVLGALSGSNGTSNFPNASGNQYCIPGDTSTCSGPVGEWNFEEGSSTVRDSSGNNHTGSAAVFGGGSAPSLTVGKIGSALKFTQYSSDLSNGDYIDLGNWALPATLTAEAWFYPISLGSNNYIILSKGNTALDVRISGAGILTVFIGSGSANSLTDSNIDFRQAANQNKWYFVTYSFNSSTSTQSLYLNGNLVATGTTTGSTTDNTYNLWLGRHSQFNFGNFNGKIDAVRIFGYVRTPSQILWDYNRGQPAGWWKFDECQGTTAYDSSTNGNNGTINIGSGGSQIAAGNCNTSGTAWGNGKNGKINSSLNFDGTDDYVAVPSSSLFDGGTQKTISMWINPASTVPAAQVILEKGATNLTSANGGGPYGVFMCGANAVVTANDTSDNYNGFAATTTTLSTNTWYNLVFTIDTTQTGSNVTKFYINGTQQSRGTIGGCIGNSTTTLGTLRSNSSSLFMGIRDSNGTKSLPYNGQIDDIKIYNYPLTATQVQALYNNGSVNFAPITGAPD